jgi:serine/threonine-protein kinase
MYAVLSSEIKPPSEYNSDVSKDLDDVVLKALQRSPDERWQTAREMGTALRRAVARREDPLGPAEIAEWMRALFPDGEAQKHRIMEIARASDAEDRLGSRARSGKPIVKTEVSIPKTARRGRVLPSRRLPLGLLVTLIGLATMLAVVVLARLGQ